MRARNVFLITADGLRWEEVFAGAEAVLLSKEFGGISDTNSARKEFLRETPEESRKALMPFFWGELARKGQLFGHRPKGSEVRVTNGKNFSYPGYNEFLSGIADPRIDSNDKKLNANTNIFEWLNRREGFRGKVAACVNWDALTWILNAPRGEFPVWSAFDLPAGSKKLAVPAELEEVVARSKTIWANVVLDAFVGQAAKHAVRTLGPRAMYIAFGETDDWAHEGNYGRYLRAAREFDRFVGELWALCESIPQYRGQTTFVITTDHGRGPAPVAWKNHGASVADSAYMWLAVIGPDTPPLGERGQTKLITQAQIAATVGAAVGFDLTEVSPKSAPPVAEAFGLK